MKQRTNQGIRLRYHSELHRDKESILKAILALVLLAVPTSLLAEAEYLGNYSDNPYNSDSTGNPYGQYGSPYSAQSINNPYGEYGSPYSADGVANPYTTGGPQLYDSQGGFHGNLNSNPYDPDSVSNPYGRYGSPYSSESINNSYGNYGSEYSNESPNNPYGQGLQIYGK